MRRIAVTVAGTALLLVGAALLVLPGPGIPVILAGLALLATEFAWARRWKELAQARFHAALRKVRESRG